MLLYELIPSAEEDLKDIARYTLKQWGTAQSLHYAGLLEKHFREIAARTAHSRTFSQRYPQVKVSRCEHHYIFYIHANEKPPRIIAVLHERMDMLAQLKHRLVE
ncbi:MAG: type II toxin-antitoxin system RelE/ParE family toxin [Gammaproteobacteria bacterium]